jgi:hypothetical protein
MRRGRGGRGKTGLGREGLCFVVLMDWLGREGLCFLVLMDWGRRWAAWDGRDGRAGMGMHMNDLDEIMIIWVMNGAGVIRYLTCLTFFGDAIRSPDHLTSPKDTLAGRHGLVCLCNRFYRQGPYRHHVLACTHTSSPVTSCGPYTYALVTVIVLTHKMRN